MKRFVPHVRLPPYRSAAALAAVLLVLLAGTWGLRAWRTAAVQQRAEQRQAAVAEDALDRAEAQFDALQRDLLARAETVARAAPVVRTLRRRREGAQAGIEPLVRYASGLEWPARYTVEIYDPLPRLVAWRGFSIPLDDAPNALRFLEAPQTAIAGREGARRALVAWHPVRDGGRTVGGARVSKVVRFRAPVQNDYLQSYSLAEEASRATGYPLTIHYGPTLPAEVPATARTRPLRSVAGRTLAHVVLDPPPPEQLVQTVRAQYGDWMALWAALLIVVAAAVLWKWFGTALRGVGEAASPTQLLRLTVRFVVAGAAWWGARYALLALDVPARWAEDVPALVPLFDPAQLASTVGGGALRSTGDLLLSSMFAFGFGIAFVRWGGCFWTRCRSLKALRTALRAKQHTRPAPLRALLVLAATSSAVTGGVVGLSALARRAVLDSTFDFFARTGLLPRPLVLVVFCALLLLAGTLLLAAAGGVAVGRWGAVRYAPRRWEHPGWIAAALAALAAPLVGGALLGDVPPTLAAWPLLAGAAGVALIRMGLLRYEERFELLTLRRLLPAVLLLAVVLYPLLYGGMNARRQARLLDAADAFSEGGDPRVPFSLEQVLQEARRSPALRSPLTGSAPPSPAAFDSLGERLLRGSLLSSMGAYDVSLALFDSAGTLLRRYTPGPRPSPTAEQDAELEVLRSMYRTRGGSGTMVEQLTGRRTPERFQYVGLTPLRPAGRSASAPAASAGEALAGWFVVQAAPQALRPEAGTPFPRALLPESAYADLYADVALAEFQGGTLVRNLGRDFGRVRLPPAVRDALAADPALWRTEDSEGSTYLTLYQRQEATNRLRTTRRGPLRERPAVIAVRVPAVTTFDHLYYALRLVIAGFLVAVPLYVGGLVLRWRAGLLPAPQVRFRDKVLNALLGVGAVAVIVVGLVGLRVLTAENERATQQWLRQRLEQVEEVLAMEAEGGEPLYQVAERVGIDRLAARVGLDLNLYEGPRLVASSRPRLVDEHLIDGRLPIGVYQALYLEGERFAATQESIGRFPYMAGFRALTDAQGQPRFVLSAPTLPQQERIAEEQSRTVAYLFGALLVLILLVTVTALVLAGALTRPLRRLRAGLEAVGKGEFARTLPTDTRDEIGELAETFNEMREQLAESRRKLTQQERELAWREMARQVAHEIKNPLTPMKLSVQHLRRAFERADLESLPSKEAEGDDGRQGDDGRPAGRREAQREDRRFPTLFERITGTLIEQIDSLSRIANEFSSFARLPTRITEPLDLNETVEAAASLMQEEEADAEIRLRLHPEPLVVEADAEELRRLYINLIKNALQALPADAAGRRTGRVEVATTRRPAHGEKKPRARSTVTDDGSGIPEKLREKIFKPNFSTKTSGTGLGLAIARKSVEELGGQIGFETEEGTGTTFWIELPMEGRQKRAEEEP